MISSYVKRYIPFFMICYMTCQAGAETVPGLADSLEKAKKHFSFAVQYKNNENYEEAIKNYEISLAFNDTVFQVHYSFADMLLKMSRTNEAKRELLNTLMLNHDHFKSAALLSGLYHKVAQYDSALVMYETMYRLKPDSLAYLSSIAGLSAYLELHDKALAAYRELIRKGENTFDNYLRASQHAEKTGDMELADELVLQALRKQPDDTTALQTAASISLARDNTKSVIDYQQRLVVLNPSDQVLLYNLEQLCRKHGDNDQLIWVFKERIRQSPKDIALIGELAELQLFEGQTTEGIETIMQGLDVSPGDGKLRILLGDHYMEQGETDKALAEFNIALKDERWRQDALQFIGMIDRPESETEKEEREFFERGSTKNPQ